MNQPQIQEYPEWAKTYISKVEGDVLQILTEQATAFPDFITGMADKADYAYAPGKWTIKQLLGHMIDTERILAYRLTAFARGETAELPGFDEDEYVDIAHFSDRSLASFCEEFKLLRKANLFLFNSLNEAELARIGTANNKQISVLAMVYVIAGHVIHHTQVIKERYL